MSVLEFISLVWIGSFFAGLLEALTGLGVVIVPLLTLVFGADIRAAVLVRSICVTVLSDG